MRFLMVLVLTGFFCAVGLMAAMGLVPVLSDFLGAGKPDLGVRYGENDILAVRHSYEDYRTEVIKADAGMSAGSENSSLNPVPVSAGSSPTKGMSVSNAQLSALLNSDKLNLLPMRGVQARMEPGTLELSGALAADRLGPFLKSVGAKGKIPSELESYLSELDGAPLYLRLGGGVENGALNLRIQAVRIGLVPLPDSWMSNITDRGIRANLMNQGGMSIQSVQFQEGGMTFEGLLPSGWQP